MGDHFTCSICGEEHEGLVTDWAYKLPDVVWAIPEDRRSEEARFNDDLCQFGERFFIRCVLPVPFIENDGQFNWGAWAEVDWPTFERYLEIYDHDAFDEPARLGTLANGLTAYPDSFGEPVVIRFGDATKRPQLFLGPQDESRLAREQRTGISNARYHEILTIIRQR